MTLTLTVLDIAAGGTPMSGAAVYVWHCDRAGEYSMYSQSILGENYLRGVQITDDSGAVTFTSIFPAWLLGTLAARALRGVPRPGQHHRRFEDHRHLAGRPAQERVRHRSRHHRVRTVGQQPVAAHLATDNVFGNDGGVHQLGTVTGDLTKGYAVTLTVPVDTRTTPSGGDAPGGDGRPGGVPGGAPPSGMPPSGGPSPANS